MVCEENNISMPEDPATPSSPPRTEEEGEGAEGVDEAHLAMVMGEGGEGEGIVGGSEGYSITQVCDQALNVGPLIS